MPQYSASEMGDQLLTLEQLKGKLTVTDGLAQVDLPDPGVGDVAFVLPPAWNVGLREMTDSTLTGATIRINDTHYSLTKDAILTLTSRLGLTRDYVCKTPGSLVRPHLDHWWKAGAMDVKLLASDTWGLAFAPRGIVPFSNVQLADAVAHTLYPQEPESVLADFKFHSDLNLTHFRLILPDTTRTINSIRGGESEDVWSLGVEVRHSLTGRSALKMKGYLFAWWCKNGATSNHATSGSYSRKRFGQGEEVYEWAASSTGKIMEDLDHELEAVEQLVDVELEDDLSETLSSIFTRYKVPVDARKKIMDGLVESDDLTAYGLMCAITAAANDPALPPGAVAQLLEIGGDLPMTMSKRCEKCHRI